MTAQEYRAAGYEVSMQIDTAVIQRAENEVRAAYIAPITSKGDDVAEVKQAVMSLAFLRMCQQRFFATRSGGKTKTNEFGQDFDAWAKVQEMAGVCDMHIKAVRALDGSKQDAKVADICRIYFKTNWLGM